MTDEEVEIIVVILAGSDYLRSRDEPVHAFALSGVADALAHTIEAPRDG